MNSGIPDVKRERVAAGSGPVTTYQMSPDEIKEYLAKYENKASKAPKNRDGEKINQPVQHGSVRPNGNSNEQSRREDMKEKKAPDRQQFLKLIAEGRSIASAEREMGLKLNGMHYWLTKWDLKGITPDKAKEMLEIASEEKQEPAPLAEESTDSEKTIEQLQQQIKHYESELERLTQIESENKHYLTDMMQELDSWKHKAVRYRSERDELEADSDRIRQALSELKEERQLLLNTIEKAATSEHDESDNVNHPAHYTAGSIECIDAIEAAVEGLSGPLAYSTGAAIKYLWRYSRKNGIEDLQKAAWYVNRLIGEVDRDVAKAN